MDTIVQRLRARHYRHHHWVPMVSPSQFPSSSAQGIQQQMHHQNPEPYSIAIYYPEPFPPSSYENSRMPDHEYHDSVESIHLRPFPPVPVAPSSPSHSPPPQEPRRSFLRHLRSRRRSHIQRQQMLRQAVNPVSVQSRESCSSSSKDHRYWVDSSVLRDPKQTTPPTRWEFNLPSSLKKENVPLKSALSDSPTQEDNGGVPVDPRDLNQEQRRAIAERELSNLINSLG
ncbi:hypothetical protein [Pasteuria penetrans]|uniref:hypothetical protein n=1 Tax=Pasteuria penetrans TaxID=86005 RepID=UPI000FB6890D|nr:hypothetical protein [Pasteuria penetrans]